jgi:hypothetical protein
MPAQMLSMLQAPLLIKDVTVVLLPYASVIKMFTSVPLASPTELHTKSMLPLVFSTAKRFSEGGIMTIMATSPTGILSVSISQITN